MACGFFSPGPTGRSPFITCFKSSSVSSVQSLGHIQLFAVPGTAARQASLSITNSPSLLKLKYVESVMPSNHLILCGPLLLLPSILPSIRVFSNDNFSISPSNEYSGLISFRTDWFDLAVQGTLKSLLQHHSSKASILPKQMYVCIRATATPLYRIVFPTKPHILFQSAPNPSPWQPFVYFLSL